MLRVRFETTKSINVYMDDVGDEDKNEVAGMLRGLACALEGYKGVSDMTNERFWGASPVRWSFSSAEKANYFKECVDYYFSEDILKALKVKRLRKRFRSES